MPLSSADYIPRDGFQEFEDNPEGWCDGRCGQLSRNPHTGKLYVKLSHEGTKLGWQEIMNSTTEAMVGVFSGIGSPEGVLAKGVGSIYSDVTDPNHPVVWQKTGGGNGNTGWVLLLMV